MVLNLGHLNEIWGDPVFRDPPDLNVPLGVVCTDSRQLKAGDFYVPLKGENFDGHDFLQEVFNKGSQAAVVSRSCSIQIPNGLLHWIVDDTLEAYQQIALLHRVHLGVPVVAVTGSVGKTTTRELIKASLSPLGHVISSTGNNNNDVGVPLTLLTATTSHVAIVVEMGMRGLGEIERLSCCTRPDIAVITNIGSAHIGLLGNRKNIAKAKCEITSCLSSRGVVIIPAGDSLLEEELSRTWKGRVTRVALIDDLSHRDIIRKNRYSRPLPKADISGEFVHEKAALILEGELIQLPLEGRHNALNFLLAIAVARELGLSNEALHQHTVKLPSGRHGCNQVGGINLIDETYNASPESVKAALDFLVTKPGRHFAVLGAMLELGQESIAMHREIAEYAVHVGLDGIVIFGYGDEQMAMATTASAIKNFAITSEPKEAVSILKSWLISGDFVLLKASRDVALERLLPLFYES